MANYRTSRDRFYARLLFIFYSGAPEFAVKKKEKEEKKTRKDKRYLSRAGIDDRNCNIMLAITTL